MHKKSIGIAEAINQSNEVFCFRNSQERLRTRRLHTTKQAEQHRWKYIEIQFSVNWIRDADGKKWIRFGKTRRAWRISIFPSRSGHRRRIINDFDEAILRRKLINPVKLSIPSHSSSYSKPSIHRRKVIHIHTLDQSAEWASRVINHEETNEPLNHPEQSSIYPS